MELIQQQIVQVKKNERTNALKQVKRICKEYDFSAAMLEAGKGVKWIVRVFALRMASFLPLNLFKNVLGLIVLAKYFPEIKKSPYFHRREDLWSFVMNEENSEKVLFLEFGVHKGYSIKKMASYNQHPESKFVGFDSFEGLPEDWRNFVKVYKKNHFDTDGKIPESSDKRIQFVKGWFDRTLPEFLNDFNTNNCNKIIIHLDADLYSSTLYCLMLLSQYFPKMDIIFDELPGEEARALEDFLAINGGTVLFQGYASRTSHFPMQVALEYRERA